jgi:hypothetical protein
VITTIKVVAMSGGAATTRFTKTRFGLLIPGIISQSISNQQALNYSFIIQILEPLSATVISNPHAVGINNSAKVGKMVKGPSEVWAGAGLD